MEEGETEDRTNSERAACGVLALETHKAACGEAGPVEQEDLADLLANLMHMSDQSGFDFYAAMQSAVMHHEAEKEE